MKISRLKLIEILRSEQDRLVNRQRRILLDRAQHDTVNATAYVERTREAWLQFATNIRQAVENGGTVTAQDIPKPIRRNVGYIVGLDIWKPPKYRDVVNVTDTLEFRKIGTALRLLEAAEDEMISTYALEKAGFRIEQIMGKTTEML
jgi:hypothetical protein